MNSEVLLTLLFVTLPFVLTIVALAFRIQSDLSLNHRTAGRLRGVSNLFFAIVILLGMVLGQILGLILGMFIFGRWIHFQLAQNWANQKAAELELIWLLALAGKSARSLAEEVELYSGGAGGSRQRRLLAFADDLRKGVPLQLCLPFELFSRPVALQLQAALNGPKADAALTRLAIEQARSLGDRDQELGNSILAYPLGLLTLLVGCCGFLMYYIIPKFKKIFDDFGTELPEITIVTIGASDFFINYWYLIAAPLVAIAVLLRRQLSGIRHTSETAATVDLLGRFSVRMHAPEILRSLATAISSGQSIPAAVKVFIQQPAPRLIQSTIELFARRVQQGEDIWDELRLLGIIRGREQKVIESAARAGNLAWALETLADNLERRWLFRFNVIGAVARPLLVLLVSIPIGFFVIAMFMPLIKLLNDLS